MMKRAVKRVLLAVFSFVLVFGATPLLFAAPENGAETIETDNERFTITEDNENITKKKDRDEKAKPFNFEGETDRKLEINHESPQITNTEAEKKEQADNKVSPAQDPTDSQNTKDPKKDSENHNNKDKTNESKTEILNSPMIIWCAILLNFLLIITVTILVKTGALAGKKAKETNNEKEREKIYSTNYITKKQFDELNKNYQEVLEELEKLNSKNEKL